VVGRKVKQASLVVQPVGHRLEENPPFFVFQQAERTPIRRKQGQ
jgi:hypothetical protein